jgi:hypothetical protein
VTHGPRWWSRAALGLLLLATVARPALAQNPPVTPPTTRQQPRPNVPIDTAQARKDSLKAIPIVRWEPADSIGVALMQRRGYAVVRYQSEDVTFGAKSRMITLSGIKGARSAVQREQAVLVADTIRYIDTSSVVAARGDSIKLRDPSRNGDLDALGFLDYNFGQRVGLANDVSTSAKSGETWYITAHRAGFAGDTTAAAKSSFYGMDGTITSCDDSLPHYHFSSSEIKRVTGSVMVARPAIFYIQDIPVMWFPFIFQDSRDGRRSGILTPQFGLTELVRNSPTYRRTVSNVGYYFALSEYYDLSVSFDWRSSAKATDVDPGWMRYNAGMRYRWLDRFVSGTVAVTHHANSTGATNTQVTWNHQQDFSINSHLTFGLNYATNTSVQRQTAINPLAVLATIASQANYQRTLGDVSVSLGGTARQYPGRKQVDQDLPSLNITSKPIKIADWLLWTPGFSSSMSRSLHLDSQSDVASQFFLRADGSLDSGKVDRSTRTTQATFNTPFKLTLFGKYDFQIGTGFRLQDRENRYPEQRIIVDVADTSKRSVRVFDRTYLTTVDFDLNVALPQIEITRFGLDKFHLVPSVSVANVDPNPFWVRSERTGATFVGQSKRLSYGLSAAPTIFGFFPGFGPVSRIRHAINPTFSYSYSAASSVSDAYLAALGKTRADYIGNIAQNRVTLGINQTVEVKLRQSADSTVLNPDGGRKVKVLSLNFTPLTWDFERARKTKKSGFSNDNFGFTIQSDLLPGFDFGADYSLFLGSVLSDTAKFSPYLTNIRAGFSLNAQSPLVGLIARLFGGGGASGAVREDSTAQRALQAGGSRLGGTTNVAGQNVRGGVTDINPRGFELNIGLTKSQQRPPVGGKIIEYDATLQCAPLKDVNPVQYELCVAAALVAPPVVQNNTQTTAGGAFIRYPPTTNVQVRTNFNLTKNWSTSWTTNYDVEKSAFGSQQVSLQRDLHDWKAIFGFTQAPNGNFAFTFLVSLKAEPDIKLPYDKTSYRLSTRTP